MTDLPGEGRKKRTRVLAGGLLAMALLAVAVGLTAANYRFAASNPGGNDFIPRWLGTRLLLAEGQNPYGEETSLAIQEFIYGRAATAAEDQVLFVYPLYASLVFGPFAVIGDYVLARALWMTALQTALLLMALISIRLAGWQPALPLLALTLLFAVTWYHAVRPLINGNASILMALFMTAGLAAIWARRDVAAGGLLALSTIKPQAAVLFLAFVIFWALSWRRYTIIASTLAFLGGFVVLGMFFEPSWIAQNLAQVTAYPDYTLAGTPADIFAEWWPAAGNWLGVLLSVMLVGLLLWSWRLAWERDFSVMLPVALMTLSATNLIGITTAASNYIALFPGVILLLATLRRDKGKLRDWPAILVLATLLIGLWWLFWVSRSGRAQSPVMFFPVPVLLLVTLPFVAKAAAEVANELPE